MNFRIKVESSGIADKLKNLEKLSGFACEEGVKVIGLTSARALAMKVQPYGIKPNAKHDKFLKSIKAQVDRAWFGVNVGAFPATTDMKQAHYQARVKGSVPFRLFRKEKGKPWLNLIPKSDANAHAEKQMRKAGRAKAAWIEAGNSLMVKSRKPGGDTQKISGVAQWINRHVGSGWGVSSLSGRSSSAIATMQNKTPYLSTLQKNSQMKSALVLGRKNGVKRIDFIIKGEIRRMEKQSKRAEKQRLSQIKKYNRFQAAAARLHSGKYSI